MILNGSGSRSPCGTPSGRQFSVGLKAPACVCLRRRSAPAGVSGRSSGLKSDRTSRKYFELGDSPRPNSPPGARGSACTCQIPERSGLPFTIGTGPVMLILPSAVRGAPAIGWFNHWARIDTPATTQATTIHNRDQALRRIVEALVLRIGKTAVNNTRSFRVARASDASRDDALDE